MNKGFAVLLSFMIAFSLVSVSAAGRTAICLYDFQANLVATYPVQNEYTHPLYENYYGNFIMAGSVDYQFYVHDENISLLEIQADGSILEIISYNVPIADSQSVLTVFNETIVLSSVFPDTLSNTNAISLEYYHINGSYISSNNLNIDVLIADNLLPGETKAHSGMLKAQKQYLYLNPTIQMANDSLYTNLIRFNLQSGKIDLEKTPWFNHIAVSSNGEILAGEGSDYLITHDFLNDTTHTLPKEHNYLLEQGIIYENSIITPAPVNIIDLFEINLSTGLANEIGPISNGFGKIVQHVANYLISIADCGGDASRLYFTNIPAITLILIALSRMFSQALTNKNEFV